jgi:hypothetical protein
MTCLNDCLLKSYLRVSQHLLLLAAVKLGDRKVVAMVTTKSYLSPAISCRAIATPTLNCDLSFRYGCPLTYCTRVKRNVSFILGNIAC